MKKKILFTFVLVVMFLNSIFCIVYGWKIPVIKKIEQLNIPDGCETVYETKVRISDVYWEHVKGEKVIKCSLGYEATKEYIETQNSEEALEYIDIYAYEGPSDIAIYNAEFDEEFWKQPDRENYVVISYLRKMQE